VPRPWWLLHGDRNSSLARSARKGHQHLLLVYLAGIAPRNQAGQVSQPTTGRPGVPFNGRPLGSTERWLLNGPAWPYRPPAETNLISTSSASANLPSPRLSTRSATSADVRPNPRSPATVAAGLLGCWGQVSWPRTAPLGKGAVWTLT
jgi:hypothetical protein